MPRSRYPHPARIQSLLFDRDLFTVAKAKDWAHRHGFRYGQVEEGPTTIRLRQFDPSECAPGTFGTKPLREGVQAVFCGHRRNPPPLLVVYNPPARGGVQTMNITVHNPRYRRRNPEESRDIPALLLQRALSSRKRNDPDPDHHHRAMPPVVVVSPNPIRRRRRNEPDPNPRRRRNEPDPNPRRFRIRRRRNEPNPRRRNPLLPPAQEWIELASDGAAAVVGGFFAGKLSEMFLKEQEGNRWIAAVKRLLIGFIGMSVLRPVSSRFARMFAVGAAVSALQPIIVPYIQIGPFAPQPAPAPASTPPSTSTPPSSGTSGIYPVEQTVLPDLAGIYAADQINVTEPSF
jgi:hypothetical protein